MLTLYNAVSEDGFIARLDGSEDFIPDEAWDIFLELCTKYKTLVVGRKTYEAMQGYEPEPLQLLEVLPIRKIVVTKNTGFKPKVGYEVAHSISEVYEMAPDALVSSGPSLNDAFICAGFVDKVIQAKIPVRIGEGIKVFDGKVTLIPLGTEKIINDLEVSEYRIT